MLLQFVQLQLVQNCPAAKQSQYSFKHLDFLQLHRFNLQRRSHVSGSPTFYCLLCVVHASTVVTWKSLLGWLEGERACRQLLVLYGLWGRHPRTCAASIALMMDLARRRTLPWLRTHVPSCPWMS